jgi:hypothetical protein
MTLKYPADIDGSSDWIQFSFGDYKPPVSGGSSAYSQTQGYTASGSTIAMNMPSDVGTSFSGNWQGKDTTSLAQFALGAVAEPISQAVTKGNLQGAIDSVFKNPGEKFTNFAKAAGDDAVKYLATSFSNLPGLGANLNYNDVLALTSGTILNPNTELLYSGFGLRSHGYSFKMIPQSSGEAQAILDIVKTFREACVPSTANSIFGTEGKNFINLPKLCEVKFFKAGGGENEYLPKYKVSGITSVNISYVTEGSYMSFEDGKPIGIQLTVGFKETKLVFRDDLESGRAR